jgi:anti-anti-sigma factor
MLGRVVPEGEARAVGEKALRGEVEKRGDEGTPAPAGSGRPRIGRFALRTGVRGDERRLALAGELDLASTPKLARAVSSAIAAGARRVILDLRELDFIDASGLHVVMQARESCRETGCEFAVVPGPRQVQRVFELTGVLSDLELRGEVEVEVELERPEAP